MADLVSSRNFWQQKAMENPYWYVSSYGTYKREDLSEFWASGVSIWNNLKRITGYHPLSTHTVVEIGCGVGRLTRVISKEVGTVHAFDISQPMLDIAGSAKLPNVNFYLANGDDLQPLPTGSADLVLAYCIFQHLPNVGVLARYITEMARVAKPGALCAFTLVPRTWHDNFRFLMKLKARLRDVIGSGAKGLGTDEWLGIRPTTEQVRSLADFELSLRDMGNERRLFWFNKLRG